MQQYHAVDFLRVKAIFICIVSYYVIIRKIIVFRKHYPQNNVLLHALALIRTRTIIELIKSCDLTMNNLYGYVSN